jgi:tRNA dimethylallyltransferase
VSTRCVLIAGPTASGKSALATGLAERLGGIVVNADAMQVYRDLRVLTARPSAAEEARVPHRLYGTVDGAEAWSVARWLEGAAALLEAAERDRRPLVFVGGTGLYFEALTRGLAAVPPIPEEIRERWRADQRPTAELHAALAGRDADMAARVRPSDRQRVLRALEVFEATGRSLRAWQAGTGEPILPEASVTKLLLMPPREELHRRIDRRFAAMLEAGALEEVEALLARRLPPELPVMKALGVAPVAAFLRGEISREDAVALGARDTRRYAKRQSTWFRNRMSDWTALGAPCEPEPDDVLARIV